MLIDFLACFDILEVDLFHIEYGGSDMKIVQVAPKSGIDSKLKTLLKNKVSELRGRPTAFHRDRRGRWKHVKYPGWINLEETKGGLLIAEIRTKVEGTEWQLLRAFIGYLDRHLGKNIESISIYYFDI